MAFRVAARAVWGAHIDSLAEFRKRAALLTPEEYEKLYREHPRIHDDTDNSVTCIDKIIGDIDGASVCDVGCGTGHLLRMIHKAYGSRLERYVGVDFIIPEYFRCEGLEFIEALIEGLPFPDQAFDTVVCTHVLEHILDYRAAISELRRITSKRLIIVVPREREALYTFNPHFNFFAYAHSFLRAMILILPAARSVATFTIRRNRPTASDIKIVTVIGAVAMLIATPYVLDYDLMMLAVAIAFYVRHGLARGFHDFELSLLVFVWVAPLLTRPVAHATGIPLGLIAQIILFVMAIDRARRELAIPQGSVRLAQA